MSRIRIVEVTRFLIFVSISKIPLAKIQLSPCNQRKGNKMCKIQNLKTKIGIFGLFTFFASSTALLSSASASDQVGTVTQTQGDVKIFSHPSKTPPSSATQNGKKSVHVLFEGEFYLVNDAKIGDKVENGNIVKTPPGAKARVIFENGDQINVGSGTAYRIHWTQDSAQAETQVSLMYGKLRGVIEKGGPRSHLQVRTRTAVMGVRGTDFFIAEGAGDGATEVSIIRGSVEVTPVIPKPTPEKTQGKLSAERKISQEAAPVAVKPIQVSAGYSAEVGAQTPPEASPKGTKEASQQAGNPVTAKITPAVELRKTTQEEFIGIQKSSVIAAPPPSPTQEVAKANPSIQKIALLEKKATETTLQDIKTYDKKLYAMIEKNPEKARSIDAVNQAALQTLIKEAPKAPKKHKPYQSELDDLDNSAYEKYFKIID